MEFDPRLKSAMGEIGAVLEKYDIAGYIMLVSKSHSEFRFEITPSWSAMQWQTENGIKKGLRFRVKSSEMKNKEDARLLTELTAHIVFQLRDLCGKGFIQFDSLCRRLKQELPGLEHKSFVGFTPHQEN